MYCYVLEHKNFLPFSHYFDKKQAAPKAAEAQGATADQSNSSFEKTVKTCCDNVQKRLQKEFDRNLDIFDRYVKKNVSAATSAAGARREPTGSAAAVTTAGNGGAIGGGAVAEVGAAVAGGGRESTPLSASKPGRGVREGWTFEVEEGSAPKRLEEEEALDADIKRLRKRRREVSRFGIGFGGLVDSCIFSAELACSLRVSAFFLRYCDYVFPRRGQGVGGWFFATTAVVMASLS